MFDLKSYDYIVDAIDTMPSKILLIEQAKACHTPIISCLSTCGRINPSRFEITDISKTSVCPAAKIMRTELKKRGIRRVRVVYSKERPRRMPEDETGGRADFAAGRRIFCAGRGGNASCGRGCERYPGGKAGEAFSAGKTG